MKISQSLVDYKEFQRMLKDFQRIPIDLAVFQDISTDFLGIHKFHRILKIEEDFNIFQRTLRDFRVFELF